MVKPNSKNTANMKSKEKLNKVVPGAPFPCRAKCPHTFKKIDALLYHLGSYHRNEKLSVCKFPWCSAVYVSGEDHTEHRQDYWVAIAAAAAASAAAGTPPEDKDED